MCGGGGGRGPFFNQIISSIIPISLPSSSVLPVVSMVPGDVNEGHGPRDGQNEEICESDCISSRSPCHFYISLSSGYINRLLFYMAIAVWNNLC